MVERRDYLTKNGIPQLFECLLTGLMYHRPDDHLNYLQQCIEQIKTYGLNIVQWDLFIQSKPIEQYSTNVETKNEKDHSPQHNNTISEIILPTLSIKLDAIIICIIAGPGIDRGKFSKQFITHYPKLIYVNLSDLLRTEANNQKNLQKSYWNEALKLMNNGELLSNDIVLATLLSTMNEFPEADGYIIDGYPKTEMQYYDLKKH
ncbi:unnamed protein product, partial [Schistosoma turkestanicum]